MVKIDKLIQSDHILVGYDHPNHHTAYDDSPRIWHKLPRSYVQIMKELHYKWIDWKSEATQECSLTKTNFTMGKSVRLLALPRKTNPGLVRELKPIPERPKGISLQRALFFEGVKWLKRIRNKRMRGRGYWQRYRGSDMFVLAPTVPALDDRPVSKSPDLTLEFMFSLLKDSHTHPN